MKNFLLQYKSAYTGLPTKAWFLSFVILINRTGSMVFFFMTLYLTRQLGYTVSHAGQMISIYGVGALFGSLLGGWLSDKIGALQVQLVSLLLSGLAYILLGYVDKSLEIAGLLFFIAVVSEAFRPANATAMAEVCSPELRSRGFALNRLAVNLGVSIGPAVGGILATINYLYLFWVDGITCLLAAILLGFFFRQFRIEIGAKETVKDVISISPWKDNIFIFILGLLLLVGIAFFQIFNTWPLYLKSFYNLLEDKIGVLLALNALLVTIIEMPLIHRLESKNIIKIIGLGGFLLLLGFGILPLGNTFGYAAFTVIVWSIGEMLVFPLLAGFIANRATNQNRGKYMGMFTFTFSLALVIGPALGTWIYDTFSPEILWYGIGVAGIFIWIGFTYIHHQLPSKLYNKY